MSKLVLVALEKLKVGPVVPVERVCFCQFGIVYQALSDPDQSSIQTSQRKAQIPFLSSSLPAVFLCGKKKPPSSQLVFSPNFSSLRGWAWNWDNSFLMAQATASVTQHPNTPFSTYLDFQTPKQLFSSMMQLSFLHSHSFFTLTQNTMFQQSLIYGPVVARFSESRDTEAVSKKQSFVDASARSKDSYPKAEPYL